VAAKAGRNSEKSGTGPGTWKNRFVMTEPQAPKTDKKGNSLLCWQKMIFCFFVCIWLVGGETTNPGSKAKQSSKQSPLTQRLFALFMYSCLKRHFFYLLIHERCQLIALKNNSSRKQRTGHVS
jgi:hypothetical protein